MSPDRDTTYACTSEIKKFLVYLNSVISQANDPDPIYPNQPKNTASNQGELQQIIKKTQSSQGKKGEIKHEAAEGRNRKRCHSIIGISFLSFRSPFVLPIKSSAQNGLLL